MQLKLSSRTVDGIAVVDCDGRIIFGEESASLRDALKSMLTMNNQIVLNLGGINYFDSPRKSHTAHRGPATSD